MKQASRLLLMVTLAQCAMAQSNPRVVRVTPDTIPAHIEVAVSGEGETKRIVRDYTAIWYATVRALAADIPTDVLRVRVLLRDAGHQ